MKKKGGEELEGEREKEILNDVFREKERHTDSQIHVSTDSWINFKG